MSRGGRKPRRRGLSEEDRVVWERVIQSVTPIRPPDGNRAPAFPPDRPEGEGDAGRSESARASRDPAALTAGDGSRRREPPAQPLPVSFRPSGRRLGAVGRPEPGLDRRTAERLRRGEREPDARIDLHGMTADRAHRALDRFIGRALAEGHRCVLVITGKGGARHRGDDAPFMRSGAGVLRQAAPEWLLSGRHAGRVVGVFAAHRRHGGEGAFYVYLKKSR
mgnify:CR=1 FL=1